MIPPHRAHFGSPTSVGDIAMFASPDALELAQHLQTASLQLPASSAPPNLTGKNTLAVGGDFDETHGQRDQISATLMQIRQSSGCWNDHRANADR